ncbi:TonB-dependent receptor domain-containing protein [Fidelibacter multiformis]|uniref:TonB-dependent receptor n=1 Tax=Fidelibacter multiformis TaxID=3377529 RepID=UPI0037DC4BEC
MRRSLRIAIMALFLQCSILSAGTSGKIAGRVIDGETGEPLIGVNIIVEGTSHGAATNADGYYTILNMMPGTYSVRASMIGYQAVVQQNVQVMIDLTTPLDFELTTEVLAGQEVIVIAKMPTVKKDVTSTSFRVSSDEIEQLQVQTLSDIVNLQAGVVEGHFRGGRAGEVMYIVDGIPMNDAYSGDNLFDVESDMIQEVEIISGTFNAEYGQAMSGIVNIVTKEGQKHYSGKLSFFSGDYLSSHTKTFMHIDHINPLSVSNLQMSLSGPLPFMKERISFSILGRVYGNDGWQYGRRIFRPQDFSTFSDNPEENVIQSTGDSTYVPMNPSEIKTLQGKISLKVSQRDKINYTFFYEDEYHRDFDRLFKYNPDGNYHHESNSYQNGLQYTRMFGKSTFLTANASESFTEYSQYVYKDPHDPRYVPIEHLTQNNSNGFSTGGMRMWHHFRNNRTRIAKADLRSQFTRSQTLGLGVSYKQCRLWLHEYQLYFDENDEIRIPSDSSWYNNSYTRKPVEIAAYIQDKLELGEMIINMGVRLDYFDPNGEVPEYFYDTQGAPKREAKTSHQWSPRIGIAYPISDQGVIHFSYGHFFQVPNYEHLYINPDFEVNLIQLKGDQPPRGRYNIMGNAELKPEKTVSYEIGIKQAITSNLTIDITGYNKDIRDLIGQITMQNIYGGKFWRFINRDYANVKGITVALEMLEQPGSVGFSVDYTYQSATGNASDPMDESKNQESDPPIQSEKKRRPLDWDQTHSLNMSMTTTQMGFHISLIGKIGSGTPYTRESPYYNNRILNGERKPMTMTFDLNVTKDFFLNSWIISPFMKITNLLDRKNNREVYPSSGTADYNYDMVFETYRGYKTQEEWYTQPNFYDEPRKVIIGCSLSFDQKR